ncbi:MAG: hypothetical protein F2947_08780 [Actinobacteria bacterium]|uniref:Unannotated protein n=1 Tax=freshwater metagenome TaxID=449393 RepID=A0A6J7NR56_9ZZZZ|nr:hypothetical protein [Actinomycetota bacterium]MSW32079.1 hypothetical protein [Actinomycetota bacterium]MSX33965.1 hypothetical protein [Actinomycetota bacterium]MSX96256.1 hypothetical protein [Actinomycetota bacterium]MSY24694.1 hypothetical protein [Actinomycetota bacterium]
MEASSLRFAAAARTLGEVARAAGLVVPSFRSPPRLAGVDRTMKRQSDALGGEAVTIAVRIKGRPWVSVLADMIDGVIVSNSLSGPTAGAARTVMWGAVEADVMRGTAPHEGAGVPKQRTGSPSAQSVRRRGPQPAGQPQTRVA